MGKITILNNNQKMVLDEFKSNKGLSSIFYLSGGTALSEYYFKHRISDDLDFFSEKKFDTHPIIAFFKKLSEKLHYSIKTSFNDPTHTYFLDFDNGDKLKIDFAYYPFQRLKDPENIKGVNIDSLYDISVNKLLLTNQRTQVKDFVDLYFTFKKYNFWELRDGVIAKFNIELEPFLMASDFMKVDEFKIMPRMLKPITLEELKDFYHKKAKKLGYSYIT